MKSIIVFVIQLLQITKLCSLSGGISSTFKLITSYEDCVCPGSTLVYECNITKGATLVFHGSAFDCPSTNNDITFLQSHDNQSVIKSCNYGAIVAETVIDRTTVSSRLTVTLNNKVMNKKSIICSVDNGTVVMHIGIFYIPQFSDIETPSPPSNIHWERIGYDVVTFSWNPINSLTNCSSVHYNIRETDCGVCPSFSRKASITCRNISNITLYMCSISVQSVVCGNITSDWSDAVYLLRTDDSMLSKISTLTLATVLSSIAVLLLGIGVILFALLARRKAVRSKTTVNRASPTSCGVVNNTQSESASCVTPKPKPTFRCVSSSKSQPLGEGYCLCQSDYYEITVSNDNYIYSNLDLDDCEVQDTHSKFETNRALKTKSTLSGCVRYQDESMKLEDMLAKLRGKVDSKWYQFGLAIGLPKEMLSQLVGYSNEDCLVEVLDYWLKHHPDQPTWKELADALEDLQDYELATVILNVYETGSRNYDVTSHSKQRNYSNM